VPVTLKESMQLERPTLMAEPVKEFGKVKLPLFNP